jgi:hypothetical protein
MSNPPKKSHASRGHLISLGSIESIPRRCEFICGNITEVHQSLQALLQGFNCSRRICDIPSAPSNHAYVWQKYIPYVWIRKFILASEGCGIVYPQNSTSGLTGVGVSYCDISENQNKADSLLHDGVT